MREVVVAVNGRTLCTAGVGPDGALSAIVNWVGRPGNDPGGRLGFHVGGLDSTTREHVDWATPELGVGDVVTVEKYKVETADPPARRYIPERTGVG